MTHITIIPDTVKKRLRFSGDAIAAGEHVNVTVTAFADRINNRNLRLRVMSCNRLVALFPHIDSDLWTADDDGNAVCELNLNSIELKKATSCGGDEFWFVLDDVTVPQKYGAGGLFIDEWRQEPGADEPYCLDRYPDIIREFGERLDDFGIKVNAAKSAAESASGSAVDAANSARSAGQSAAAAQAAVVSKITRPSGGSTGDVLVKTDDGEAWGPGGSPDWSSIRNKPSAFTPSTHASTHATNGSDPITPSAIGAVATEPGKGLSSNDYTSAEKTKLAGIEDGAEVNPTPVAPSTEIAEGAFADAKLTADHLAGKQDAIQQLTAALVAWLAAFKGQDTSTTLASVLAAIAGKLDKSGGTISGELTVSGNATFGGDDTTVTNLTASYLDAYLGFKVHGVPFYFPNTSGTVVVRQDLNEYLRDYTDEYDEDSTYAVGAFVKYQGSLYVCKTAITTAEAWTPAHWTALPNVSALFSSANTALTSRVNALIDAKVGDVNAVLAAALDGTEVA